MPRRSQPALGVLVAACVALEARAADPVPPGDPALEPRFTLEAASIGRFEVRSFPAPPARTLPPQDRVCAVRLAWTGSALSGHDAGCPAVVAPEVLATVDQWQVAGPSAPAELGEVWFVYPTAYAGPPRLLVRQSEAWSLTLPPGVDAVPFRIRAWSFLRYPPDVHQHGLPDVSCTVHVESDARGYPTEVQAEGCADPYRTAATEAVRAWRFTPVPVEGGPIGSALSFRTTFVSADAERVVSAAPSEESARLWAARQFDALDREERIWFIRAALLGPESPLGTGRSGPRDAAGLPDLGPGQVRVRLPAEPDLGGRPQPTFFTDAPRAAPRALPDHPPVLRLGAADVAEIGVYELELPPSPLGDGQQAECPVLVQVDGERQVFSWAEADCDPEVREVSLRAADAWLVAHDGEQDHATRRRFRATFRYDTEGTSLVLPAEDVRTAPGELPAGVHTWRDPRPTRRTPPRLPDGPLPEGQCWIQVAVDARGRTRDARITECPAEIADAALRAVERWQWAPAEFDGEAVPAELPVGIGFRP